MKNTQLWYQKYRPTDLEGYVFRDNALREKLTEWLNDPGSMPNLILAGPPGTGKTTLALMLQELLGLDSGDFLFLNCTIKRNSSIDVIRGDITNHCENAGWGGFKVVVIDEANRLSFAAQESLKGPMDAYGEYTRFIFTTNHVRKMDAAVLSRARTITMDAMDMDDFIGRVLMVAQTEGIIGDDPQEAEILALQEIVDRAYPDLRKAIDTLQDSVRGGKLVSPSEDAVIDATWTQVVIDTIAGDGTLDNLRRTLAGIRTEDIEDIYRFLYEHVTELVDHPEDAITTIAEYLDRHARSAFPDITLAALLLELQEL